MKADLKYRGARVIMRSMEHRNQSDRSGYMLSLDLFHFVGISQFSPHRAQCPRDTATDDSTRLQGIVSPASPVISMSPVQCPHQSPPRRLTPQASCSQGSWVSALTVLFPNSSRELAAGARQQFPSTVVDSYFQSCENQQENTVGVLNSFMLPSGVQKKAHLT